ncbi:pyrimidine/purine nucleotide monophosphate nucleosidase domain-containing protein, partial [Cognatiluteimonas profundi]|uniref:pyrimidine/purine nucleotide monophosphate nucleosidase domain-containing protein n=1 Tax=Cognatiluteimonas profundi TaxID=2594501 RepID=UPI00131C8E74
DCAEVARQIARRIRDVREYRLATQDSFYSNWSPDIPLPFQQPFVPTHEAMAALDLHHGRTPSHLAADLRPAF